MADILVVSLARNRIIDETSNSIEVINKFQSLADTIIKIINSVMNLKESEDPSVAWLFIENEVLNFVTITNHVLNVAEEFLVKIIDEAVNFIFSEDHVIGVELGEAIVKIFTEFIDLISVEIPVRILVRQFVNRFQISETIDQNKFFSKVIDDVINFIETRNEFVVGVTTELVQVVADVMNFIETTVTAVGLTVIVDEVLSLIDSVIGIAYVIGQVIAKFVTGVAVKVTFWFNRDVEQ